MGCLQVANPRILISAGCSFSQVPGNNWPLYLRDSLGIQAFFDGAGSAGNDIISKRVIFRVNQCLNVKKIKTDDLLVGVMWSGVSRKSVYLTQEPEKYYRDIPPPFPQNWHNSNPCSVGGENNNYLMHPMWDEKLSQTFYKHYFDDIGMYIQTIENILRIQWFLKLHKIKYFFTRYNIDSIDGYAYAKYNDHVDIKYLRDQIDYSNFLPIENMYHWAIQDGFTFDRTCHPTPEMSKIFVDRVILPHLKSKGYIS